MEQAIELGHVSMKNKVVRTLWYIVRAFFFRPFGTKLFNPWRILLLKLFGADVKWDSGVYSSVKLWAPWNLKMGHNAWLGPDVICYNMALICIEDNVTVSQYAYLCTAGHRTNVVNDKEEGLIVAPIIIKKGSWIGARAFIGMGVELGEYSIVGATASVYKDVDPYTIVGGNPAKMIKKRVMKE